MFKQSDKVYFHRGPVELAGVVESTSSGVVTLRGVELGFGSPICEELVVSHLDHLCTMDDETFENLTRDEPAFAEFHGEQRPRPTPSESHTLSASG